MGNTESVSNENTDPSFKASNHNIISLDDILHNSQPALAKLTHEFTTRGWSIVRMPSKDTQPLGRQYYHPIDYSKFKASSAHTKALSSFFSQSSSDKEKSYGFTEVDHKESVHITTPYWSYEDKISPSIKEAITQWSTYGDEIALDLIEILSNSVFNCDKATLAHRADLPVAFGIPAIMLDVAFYKNNKTVTLSPEVGLSTEDVNCVPHYDPGLLSLSFLSTHDGLQLQDPATGTWYAGPVNTRRGEEDLAVIWLGSAAVKASNGKLKAGIHRVVYPQSSAPRMAAWFEICTVEQVNEERKSSIPKTGEVELANAPGAKKLLLTGDIRLIERHFGMPMSKVMKKSDDFSAAYSADRPQNSSNENDFSF